MVACARMQQLRQEVTTPILLRVIWDRRLARKRMGLARAQTRMERVKGIEPSYAAWEAAVLPLNYTRVS